MQHPRFSSVLDGARERFSISLWIELEVWYCLRVLHYILHTRLGFHKRGNSHTTEHIFLHYKQTHHPGITVLPLSRLKEVLTTLYSSTSFLSLLLPVYFTRTVSEIWSRAGQFRPPHFSQYPSQILSTNFCCNLLFCFLHSAAPVACCNLQPATCCCLRPAAPTACCSLLPVTS